jgi:prepilin-type N-terminal cleavage/methylation domain-containing protein
MWYLDSAFLNYFRRDYMIIASAHKRTASAKKKSGFTLIELSIVLVIIGLIIGGVLVGQDLIKAAEIRATIGQYEKYNAAINTFRTKYNSIPGDMPAADSTAFGLNATAGATDGTRGLGDGNGLIERVAGNVTDTTFNAGEPLQFWGHLSRANLVDGSLGAAMTTGGLAGANLTAGTATTYFPAAKSGRGGIWYAGSTNGLNYYVLTGAGAITAATGATVQASAATPIEAFNIDSKIDDGLPNAGIVQARGTSGNPFLDLSHASTVVGEHATTENASTLCQIGATSSNAANTYARGSTAGSGVNCSLRFRFN